MATSWQVDVSEVERIAAKLETYGEEAITIIKDYLLNEGFERIAPSIQKLIPASGRNWKGKKPAASSADYNHVFDRFVVDTTLEIDAHYPDYHYLYFPDDGSNTLHHFGGMEFMLRGAEAAGTQVVDEILARLTAAFND